MRTGHTAGACDASTRERQPPGADRPLRGRHPYRADDPGLLLWVLFTLVDSALVVYRRYVHSLSRAEEASFWEDYKVVGRLFGLRQRDMPATVDDLDEYRRRMLEGDELLVTDWARRRARQIVLAPPVPLLARPLLETVNFVTIALLPDPIREQYGFSSLPPAADAQGARGGRRRLCQACGHTVSARPHSAGPERAGGVSRCWRLEDAAGDAADQPRGGTARHACGRGHRGVGGPRHVTVGVALRTEYVRTTLPPLAATSVSNRIRAPSGRA